MTADTTKRVDRFDLAPETISGVTASAEGYYTRYYDYSVMCDQFVRKLSKQHEECAALLRQVVELEANLAEREAKIAGFEIAHEQAVKTIQVGYSIVNALAEELRAAGCDIEGDQLHVVNKRAEAAERALSQARDFNAEVNLLLDVAKHERDAAERARDEACGLLLDITGLVDEALGIKCGEGHTKGRPGSLAERIAAFLAANGENHK